MSSAKNDSVQLGVASQGNTCSYLRLRPFAQRLFHIDLHYIYVASKCSSILTTTSPVSTSCNNNLSCQGPLPFDESFANLNSVRPRKSDKEVKKKIFRNRHWCKTNKQTKIAITEQESFVVCYFTIWREQVSIKDSDAEHILLKAFHRESHLRRKIKENALLLSDGMDTIKNRSASYLIVSWFANFT